MKSRIVRMNFGLPEDLKKWYDETADQLGLTTTGFMVMALQQMREGTEQAKQIFLDKQNANLMTQMVKPGERVEESLRRITTETIKQVMDV